MTVSAAWHARIDCGREVGAGFLISPRQVLTCAHVVRDSLPGAGAPPAPVTVTFPAHAGLGERPAAVLAHGGWEGRATDPGDLAVLELAEPVTTIGTARFAPLDEAPGHPPRRLVAYGFPHGYDEGTLAEYRTTSPQLIADEWAQLEAWNGHGQPLAPGFSGAAVVVADTGQVVGMVSAVAGNPQIRNGRMLPAPVMARYWPPLGALIPTPGYGQREKEELRTLVAAAARTGPRCDPAHLYADAVGPMGPVAPPRGFPSLWAAAWYLLTEVADAEAVARFTTRLADFVADREVRHALQRWPHRSGTPTGAVARPAPSWSPILVDIARSGAGRGQALVEVSAYRDGHRRVVGSRSLPKSRVRGYVLERIDEAFRELRPGAEELIAFVLPSEWINEPVAGWQRGKGDPSPLGCFSPLVVMDRSRRTSGALQHKLLRKWEELDARAAGELRRIECDNRDDPGRLTIRLRKGADVVGLAAPPKSALARRHYEAGLNAPVPVMLWPRTGCPTHHGDAGDPACCGSAFLDALAEHLAGLSPADLPRHVLRLRETAYASDSDEPHWAQDLTLLWEDPRCFPDTTGHLASPVA